MPRTAGLPSAPFIVGAIRSGTTLLRLMLDAHRALAIPSETSFPREFFRRAAGARTTRNALIAELSGMEKFADLHMTPEMLSTALPDGMFAVGEGLRRMYRSYAARFGKLRWGDKSPRYVLSMRAIKRVLPEAYFIHVIRDGRDTLASQREARHGLIDNRAREAGRHARYWQECIVKGRRQGAEVQDYTEVRYERLVSEPEAVLRELCSLIELDFDPLMLRYHERAAERLAEMGARQRNDGSLQTQAERLSIFSLTHQPPDIARVGRWRKELDDADIDAFEQVAGDTLKMLGYTLRTA